MCSFPLPHLLATPSPASQPSSMVLVAPVPELRKHPTTHSASGASVSTLIPRAAAAAFRPVPLPLLLVAPR